MANATASASRTQLGGTGSAAQAGATGSSGGTTTGTVACSSCCAPPGRFLVALFGGYGYVGSCPGAVDNSQPFDLYFTAVLSLNSPYTAAQFCLPSSFTITAKTINANLVEYYSSFCSTISPPSTQITVFAGPGSNFISSPSGVNLFYFGVTMCSCDPSNNVFLSGETYRVLTTISCSPPVYSFSANVYDSAFLNIGTAAITITF